MDEVRGKVFDFEKMKKHTNDVVEATAKLLDDDAISEGRREDAGYNAITMHKEKIQAIDVMLNIPFDILIVVQKNEE